MPVQQDQTLREETTSLLPSLMDQQTLDSDDKSDDVEFTCCTLEFDNEIEHLSHMISHIAEKFILLQRVQCDYCNYSFNNYNDLRRHLPKHLGFNCYYCHQHIPEWWQLVQHVMYKHNYQIKHGKKSYPNKQQNKFKRRPHITNRKRFNRKFRSKKENLDWKAKTEPGNFVKNIKTEPYDKNDSISCTNVQSEPIFNPNIVIKTEPTFVKIEPFDYF